MKSWKTTASGIAAILVAVGSFAQAYLDNDPATVPNYEATLAAIVAGVGLIAARDNDRSSASLGVK